MKAGFVTAIVLLAGAEAWAHDEKWSDSQVAVSEGRVVWRVMVSMVALEKVMAFPADPIDLSEAQLQSVKDEIVRHLRRGIGLEINGRPRTAEVGALEPVYERLPLSGEPYIGHVTQEFVFRSDEKIEDLLLALNFFGSLTEQHEAGLTVAWGETARRFIRRGPAEVAVTYDEFHPTVWTAARDFGIRGLRDFLTSAATVAFLLGTLLGAPRLRETLLAAGAFALAASAAMTVSAVDLVRIRPGIVDALIAASVMYVAAENVLTRDARFRWVVTLIFGLAHGFALGASVGETLAGAPSVALPLVVFGVGLLAGQAALVLTAGPIFAAIRGGGDGEAADRRRRRVILAGSVALGLLGAGWMIERLFSVEFMPL